MGAHRRRPCTVKFHKTVLFVDIFLDHHAFFYLLLLCYCRLEMTRHVSMVSISLSPKELNKSSPGYSVCLASFCRICFEVSTNELAWFNVCSNVSNVLLYNIVLL